MKKILKKIQKIILPTMLSIYCILPPFARAQDEEEDVEAEVNEGKTEKKSPEKPNFQSWIRTRKNDMDLGELRHLFPQMFLVVTDDGSKVVDVPVDVDAFNSFGYLFLEKSQNLDKVGLSSKSASKVTATPELSKKFGKYIPVLTVAGAPDTLIYVPKDTKSSVEFFRVEGNQFKSFLKVPNPGPIKDALKLYQWIVSSLSYDGVVIDVKNSYILLTGGRQQIGDDLQAVTLKNTAKSPSLKDTKTVASGIFSRVDAYDTLAVYKAFFPANAEKNVKVGDKIRFKENVTTLKEDQIIRRGPKKKIIIEEYEAPKIFVDGPPMLTGFFGVGGAKTSSASSYSLSLHGGVLARYLKRADPFKNNFYGIGVSNFFSEDKETINELSASVAKEITSVILEWGQEWRKPESLWSKKFSATYGYGVVGKSEVTKSDTFVSNYRISKMHALSLNYSANYKIGAEEYSEMYVGPNVTFLMQTYSSESFGAVKTFCFMAGLTLDADF